MAGFQFPRKARRNDNNGHMVVQDNLERFRDYVDTELITSYVHGSDTVAAGTTTKVVTHNLNMASYWVGITALVDPSTRFWVTNKASTSFQINLLAAAPAGGVSFDYIVRGD